MRTVAVIVAAGKGTRFRTKTPKQYLPINDRPLIYYTLSAFEDSDSIDGIVLVVAKDKIQYAKKIINKYNFKKVFAVLNGGATRAHSVYNALKAISRLGVKIVIVHDGVRPLISKDLIETITQKTKKYGAVITAVRPKNTIKEINKSGIVKKSLVRNDLIEVQTPQAFKFDLVYKCYERFKDKYERITDDSSLVEMAGYRIRVIDGDYRNIKITTNEDLKFIKSILEDYDYSYISKIGVGYDIHRLVKGRKLILGGVNIKSKYGLLGHSDADVLLHAITDAMFGALGDRDIGWHFSNKDNKYKGMESSYFLLEAKKVLEINKYKIVNIDSIIIAQEPKLQPYYMKMVRNMSSWLDMPAKSITVKFTTPEKVGPLGGKRAIAGMAVVGLVKTSY